jgi:hypothetical protein
VAKGNNPELWDKLLAVLDDKLQLGLLEHMRRVTTYHFEDETLFLEPGTPEDCNYLSKETVFHHLQLLAQDAVKVERIKIKKP